MVAAGSGKGEADPIGEYICTPNGLIKIGVIKVGDEVIGSNGKRKNGLRVYPQGERDVYRVHFNDSTYVDCDYEHLWNVNSYKQRHRSTHLKGKNITQPDFSYKTLSLREIVEDGLYKKVGKKEWINYRIPIIQKPVDFNEIEVKVNPYLFGYMIGDGSYNHCSITIGKNDYEECYNNLSLYNNAYKLYPHYREYRNVWTVVCEQKLCQDLGGYIDRNSKSNTKNIPFEYLYNSIENRILLLNGLMDSDGTCGKKGTSTFSTKSKQLAEDVKILVLSLGGYARIISKKRGYFNKKYNEYRDCGIHYEVNISLCDENIPIFKMKRKQEMVRYRTTYKFNKYIQNVEHIGKEECQCIKVDAEDELYLTRDFIVTHNTTISSALAASAATHKCEQNNNEGFKVLQIFFEDKFRGIKRKHIGKITGVEARNLSKKEYVELVRKNIDNYEDRELLEKNLKLGKFRTGELTVTQLRNYIKNVVQTGFKPDVILIDYFECLVNPKVVTNGSEWTGETAKMRELENLTEDFDSLVLVTTQGTKDSAQGMLLTLDKISGSAGKGQVAHIVITINKSEKDKEDNRGTIFIPKFREGKSGRSFNDYFNNGTCQIEVDKFFDSIDEMNENANKDTVKLNKQIEEEVLKQNKYKKNSPPLPY